MTVSLFLITRFKTLYNMLRIAVQSKGRLYDETMELLQESGISLGVSKRTLLVQAGNFPVEVLFLRDDDIPQSVAGGVADVGIVGENEFVERNEKADVIKRLGFSRCRLSLAIPKAIDYKGLEWFNGKKIATSYPGILNAFLQKNGIKAETHVITGSVEIAPGIGLADQIQIQRRMLLRRPGIPEGQVPEFNIAIQGCDRGISLVHDLRLFLQD